MSANVSPRQWSPEGHLAPSIGRYPARFLKAVVVILDLVLPMNPQDDMMQWYNRYLGWSLTHHVNKDIVAMGSPPDAGKTTLLNADVRSMGSYVTKATADTFLKPRGYAANPSAHNDGKAKLDSPARRTFIEELASPFNTEMANELSGGGIDQDYRAVGEKRRPYVRLSHMVFVYNIKEGDQTLMPMDGTSVGDALERRLYAFPLPQIPQTSQNPAMLEVANDRQFRQAYVARMVAAGQSLPHRPRPHPGAAPRLPDHAGEQIHALLPSQACRGTGFYTKHIRPATK